MPRPPASEIRHRRLDPHGEEPSVQIAKHVADISGVEPDDIGTTYAAIGELLTRLFSDPAPSAQVEVTFTFEGFRITVDQDGHAMFVPVHDPALDDDD